MSESIFSPLWHRVAGLHPRLRAHVRLERQRLRGETWYLLRDEASGRIHRVNASAYAFVGRCDGRHSVAELWEVLRIELGEQMPSQNEILSLLGRLFEGSLLEFEHSPDLKGVFRRREKAERRRKMRNANPFSFRISLGDPSRLLARLSFLAPLLFSWPALCLWLLVVGVALAAAAVNAPAIAAAVSQSARNPSSLILLWISYPLIKAVHELAHGLAVRRWGGQVGAFGVALLLLMPVPFVDASEANAFRHRHQRVFVSAAGIMAELLIAAFALVLWLNIEDGLLKDFMLAAMTIGSLSTLLVNGNPLLRFDGYYVMIDAFGLPNLASRSRQWWGAFVQRSLLGLRERTPLAEALGEWPWLLAYQPLSWLYRAFLSVLITGWVGAYSNALGYAAALWFAWVMLLQPALQGWKLLSGATIPEFRRGRAMFVGSAATAAALAIFTLLPLPWVTVAEGVVWLPQDAGLVAGSEGFVREYRVADGARVSRGDLLLVMDDDTLVTRQVELRRQLTGLESALFQSINGDAALAGNLDEDMRRVAAALAEVDARVAALDVRAARDGIVSLPHQADLVGRFVERGTMLGQIFADDPVTVRVAVKQGASALIQSHLERVEVSLADAPGKIHRAELVGEVPGATQRLPSAALASSGGGDIAADSHADDDALLTREPVVWLDVKLADIRRDRIGGRAWIRFEHGGATLFERVLRGGRQLLLQHFSPGAL